MRTYEEISARIMQKGDKMIEIRRIRNTKIRQTTFALSGMCAAVITGAGIWHLNVKDKVSRTENSSSAIEEPVNTTVSETTVNTTQTTAKTTSSNNKITTVTSEAVTAVSEAEKTTVASSAVDTQSDTLSTVSSVITSETRAEQSVNTVTQPSAVTQATTPSSQETVTEPTTYEDTDPVTIPAIVTWPAGQTVTAPSTAVTAPASFVETTVIENQIHTTTMPAEVTVDIEQRNFISYSDIAENHRLLNINFRMYELNGKYGNVADIPEGAENSGRIGVVGNDTVTGKPYSIYFEAYSTGDGSVLVRFGEGEDIYLYFCK